MLLPSCPPYLIFPRSYPLNHTDSGADPPLTRDPKRVALAYTPDCVWRNRDRFLQGRDEIEAFLTHKWFVESGYRLRKELFAFDGNKVRFVLSTLASLGP